MSNPVQKYIGFANGHVETLIHSSTRCRLMLFKNLKGTDSSLLAAAADNLRCNSVVNFNFGINRPDLSDKHWIYFPEKEYPFYRLGFGHNFSEHMTPPDCSSLYGEFAHLRSFGSIWVEKTLLMHSEKTKKLLAHC